MGGFGGFLFLMYTFINFQFFSIRSMKYFYNQIFFLFFDLL